MPARNNSTKRALITPAHIVQDTWTWRTLLPWLVPIVPALVVLLLWSSTS